MKMKPEYEGDARSTWWYVCPECRTAVDPRDENCPECGLELDWAGLLPGKGKAWDKS